MTIERCMCRTRHSTRDEDQQQKLQLFSKRASFFFKNCSFYICFLPKNSQIQCRIFDQISGMNISRVTRTTDWTSSNLGYSQEGLRRGEPKLFVLCPADDQTDQHGLRRVSPRISSILLDWE